MPRNILESGGALRLTEPRSLRAAGFMAPMRGPLWVVEAPQAHRHRLAPGAPAHQRDARIMLVDTDEDNADALAFFRQNGFGQERRHVYRSQNLDDHPLTVERRNSERNGRAG